MLRRGFAHLSWRDFFLAHRHNSPKLPCQPSRSLRESCCRHGVRQVKEDLEKLLIAEKPQRPVLHFFRERMEKQATTFADVWKEWKSMDASQQAKYEEMARAEEERFNQQPLWKKQLASLVQTKMKDERREKTKKLLINKLKKPKRYSGFTLFSVEWHSGNLVEQGKEEEFFAKPFKERSAFIVDAWHKLPESEKEKYNARAKARNENLGEANEDYKKRVAAVLPEMVCDLVPEAKQIINKIKQFEKKREEAVPQIRKAEKTIRVLEQEGLRRLTLQHEVLEKLTKHRNALTAEIKLCQASISYFERRQRNLREGRIKQTEYDALADDLTDDDAGRRAGDDDGNLPDEFAGDVDDDEPCEIPKELLGSEEEETP